MGAAEESDNDLSISKNRCLIERSLGEGFDSSLVKVLRSRLWSNSFALLKRSGVGRLMATPGFERKKRRVRCRRQNRLEVSGAL